jgi:hypothetical protein
MLNSYSSSAQSMLINDSGTIKGSHLYIDTIIDAKLPIENKLIFERIETNGNSLKLSLYCAEKYSAIIRDSVEYYFIANLTKDTLRLKKLDNRLVGQDYGKHSSGKFKPISLFIYPRSGTGINFSPAVLQPGAILIIKSKTKRTAQQETAAANCFIKIKTNDTTISSKSFGRKIATTDFYLKSQDAKILYLNKRQMAFDQ